VVSPTTAATTTTSFSVAARAFVPSGSRSGSPATVGGATMASTAATAQFYDGNGYHDDGDDAAYDDANGGNTRLNI
jgi:hypothetical protein